jgi:hypothetical protein
MLSQFPPPVWPFIAFEVVSETHCLPGGPLSLGLTCRWTDPNLGFPIHPPTGQSIRGFADPENRCHVEEEEMRDDHWIEQQGFSIFDPDIEDEPTAADEADPIEDASAWPLTLLED